MFRPIDGIAGLIDLIEPDEYRFVGSYWSQAVVPNPIPLEGYCEFLRDESSVVLAGAYRPGPGAQERGFEVFFPFAGITPHSSKVTVLLSGIERMKGAGFFRDGSLDVLCRDGELCASAHLQIDESGAMIVSGLISTSNSCFGYQINAVVPGHQETLSNVVSLKRRTG